MMGGIGAGLVWGWLIGGLADTTQKKLRNILSVGLGTILLGIEMIWFESPRGLFSFLVAAVLAWLLRFLWRNSLRRRFATPM